MPGGAPPAKTFMSPTSPPHPDAPHARIAAFLSDPEWVARVQRIVRRRVSNEAAAADIIQEAYAAAVEQDPSLPADDGAAKKYLLGVVRNKARMHVRATAIRSHQEMDEEVHGARAPESVEARDLWRRIAARVAPPRAQALTWFVRVALGESLADIARESGVDYEAALGRYFRMRNELRGHAKQLAGVALIAMLAIGITRGRRPDEHSVSSPRPPPAPTHVAPSESTTLAHAAALRRAGLRACADRHWAECLEDLDRARALDAPGDGVPEIQAARHAASAARK